MQNLTSLENPNSVQQMKEWLADNGLETDSLDKAVVAELIKTAPSDLEWCFHFVRSLPNHRSRSTPLWKTWSVQTAEPEGLSSFTVLTEPQICRQAYTGAKSPANHLPDLEDARNLIKQDCLML